MLRRFCVDEYTFRLSFACRSRSRCHLSLLSRFFWANLFVGGAFIESTFKPTQIITLELLCVIVAIVAIASDFIVPLVDFRFDL